jgi:hypothetical protein
MSQGSPCGAGLLTPPRLPDSSPAGAEAGDLSVEPVASSRELTGASSVPRNPWVDIVDSELSRRVLVVLTQ